MAATDTASTPPREIATWRGRAFGVRLSSAEPIETLTEEGDPAAGRAAAWSREDGTAEPEGRWETSLADLRFADGSVMMTIDADPDGAYRVASPGYGSHVIEADGARITSFLAPDQHWSWQRLFVAQVLPLTAALHGVEPLHASAVGVDGRAAAFTAASGTGKTSIATHLVARGAALLTDDVLALELTAIGLLAHPGARLLSVARNELDAVGDGADRLGTTLGEDDKVYLRPALAPRPLPLGLLYRLERRAPGTAFEITRDLPPDPRRLLGTSFLTYLRTPERLNRHLDVASRLAQSVRVYTVCLPSGLQAATAAELIEAHIAETTAELPE